MIELNHKGIKSKISNILDNWSSRGPSLYGKVIMLNALIGSLYVYKMQVLPTLSDGYVKEIHDVKNNYMWKGGTGKCKSDIFRIPKEQGGLRLFDLKCKDKSLKIQWAKTCMLQPESQVLANQASTYKGSYMWTANINTQDIQSIFKKGFWRDVAMVWAKYSFYTPITKPKSWIKISG